MNYLAHSFLAYSNGQIVGQFLQDYTKNNTRFSLPPQILQGIILHREIDTFTDSHPIIHEAKKVFAPLVRLYSGAFVDVAMDYFLANDATIKTPKQWKEHSHYVYKVLNENIELFPERFVKILNKMEEEDWLYHYREDWGIKFSFRNVLQMAKYLDKNLPVFQLFLDNKDFLKTCYQKFFPEIEEHIRKINQGFSI